MNKHRKDVVDDDDDNVDDDDDDVNGHSDSDSDEDDDDDDVAVGQEQTPGFLRRKKITHDESFKNSKLRSVTY